MNTDEFSLDAFKSKQEPQCFKLDALNKKGWRNKVGNDGECPFCGAWSDHWKNFSGEEFDKQLCSREGCKKKAEVGAHVIRPRDGSYEWIVPSCTEHNVTENLPNVSPESFILKEGTILVNADVGETHGEDG